MGKGTTENTTENKIQFDNFKQLTSVKKSDMPELVKNIKDAKRQIDNILKQLKEKEKEFIEVITPVDTAGNNNSVNEKSAEQESAKPTTVESIVPVESKVVKTEESEVIKKAESKVEKLPKAEKIVKAETKIEAENVEISEKRSIEDTKKSVESKAASDEKKTELKTDEAVKPQADSKKAAPAVNTEKVAKKPKTAEDKFKDSLPKPVNTENRRFINLTPEKPVRQERQDRFVPRTDDGGNRYQNNGYQNRDGRTQGGYQNRNEEGRPQGGFQNRNTGDRPPFNNQAGGFRKDFDPNRNSSTTGFRSNRPGMPPALNVQPAVEFKKDNTKQFTPAKKKTGDKTVEEKKTMNKRSLLRRGFETDPTLLSDDDVKMGSKRKAKKKEEKVGPQAIKIETTVVNTEIIPIKILSDKLGITATEITKRLFKEGIIKTINESIDFSTAELIAMGLDITLELKLDKTAEDTLAEFHEVENVTDVSLVKRPPVVTVMGHVDHGKTSILDSIKKSNVVKGEAGGITQHIGAYTINVNNEKITFIDTPGHEAFTSMRARGASVTDIAILVVAADDGIMPQTIEAINHAKAADVPIIVAINKMDKPTANPDRILQQLTEHGLVPEEWGGDAIVCPVSAHTRFGMDKLLEMILLVAEVKELKANPNRKAKGAIIEAQLDKGKGPVATVLVQNGTLRVGDTVVAGTTFGRIRAMLDDKGANVKEAGPSIAVAVLGFSEVPNAGDSMFVMEDEKLSRQVAEERLNKLKNNMIKLTTKVTLDDVFGKITEGQVKGLNLIIKGDVQGSVEAVKQAVDKLSAEEVKVNIIHGGVGAITESDVILAQAASAIVIGFNVRPDNNAKNASDRNGVDIRMYRIIYEVTDDISKALKGMLAPKFKEIILGQAQVRNAFKITGVGAVAGCYVTSGKIVRNAKIRLLRDNIVITEGSISSLKRFKDDVKEVATGFECGITIDGYNDIKENDIIECFQMEEVSN